MWAIQVTRDRMMEVMPVEEIGSVSNNLNGINRGSGYPGDPATKSWLKHAFEEVFAFPRLVRFSWSTIENWCMDNKAVVMDWHDEVDTDEKQASLADFGLQKGSRSNHRRGRFYSRRHINIGSSF